jgi:hypothetical protein
MKAGPEIKRSVGLVPLSYPGRMVQAIESALLACRIRPSLLLIVVLP